MFIKIKNVCFSYPHIKEKALDCFEMTIEKGEVISILGPSGSGKSTVLRLLSGLELPSQGSFTIQDKVIFDQHTFVQPEKRGIGMVFQDYALFPHMTVAENILFGLFNMKKSEKKARLKEVLELVEMADYEKRYPHQLSGGQQQRIAIARAIAPNPSLILLDEPFSNLDSELQLKIRKDLRNILKNAGITSIFVTHDENDALAIADRIVQIKAGKIQNIGRPCDLLGAQLPKTTFDNSEKSEPVFAGV
ncbi:ABC transporter ATP-binding protein [Lederbergia wuyishanensis]|uniref:Iron(III) transport system ATP-binding protein n=1 Tax=Lederbergia wuyishanensis TaxID=1347903 RepID=A0ABU0D825_9BACI|nr:ABC transporter ATP-binding protein [Lederbergia wuyishanensis]MCJ8009293.1 ABC transporter ATP-binding protein [Lederbergia wuyishanensis]MDQ0344573.1 iron(III) transport system ATP-binding protein [Lederbergia wuyishanensis]